MIRQSCGTIRGLYSNQSAAPDFATTAIESGIYQNETTKKIIGKTTIDKDQWQRLLEDWTARPVELICGSDGGLKDKLGTSGYVLYRDTSEGPLLTGYAAELQYGKSASSTRQELLAQLCIEYWLDHLYRLWGSPKHKLQLKVITDSQASLIIMDNMKNIVSMKDVLRPDVDVAMELARLRQQNSKHNTLQLIKVKSHIGRDEAPNETYWQANNDADELATFAREQVQAGTIIAYPPQFLKGSSAVASIGGKLCLSGVKQQIYTKIYQRDLEEFLMRKYDWNSQTFHSIDWLAQETSLQKLPLIPRSTAFKFIHGWLATTRRRCREGFFATPQCSFCQEEETRDHMFRCTEDRISQVRNKELLCLKAAILDITETTVGNAIIAGIQSVLDDYDVGIYSREFANTTNLQVAMEAQQKIGWNQFLQGRISQKWKTVGPLDSFRGDEDSWSQLIVAKTINFGLAIWKQRNRLVHGTDSGVSKRGIEKTLVMIELLYEEILPTIELEHKWLFTASIGKKLAEPYPVQVAWVDSVRRLYPAQYGKCKYKVGKENFTRQSLEYIKETSVGMVGR